MGRLHSQCTSTATTTAIDDIFGRLHTQRRILIGGRTIMATKAWAELSQDAKSD